MGLTKSERRNRIKSRVRKIVAGTAERPRLSVFRSNKEIYAQIINDTKGHTMMAAGSVEKDIASQKVNKSGKAALVGELIARKALDAGIDKVVFDRNGYLYHGRVKNLAEAARKAGLKF
ncbi:MAG: 50S ribosomal protein L18 [Bacteroidales bacterium]|jgi:large subunit ribosomal protein L18|nr:50S ribosomal protein L18 [Bacteroidales bacterium]